MSLSTYNTVPLENIASINGVLPDAIDTINTVPVESGGPVVHEDKVAYFPGVAGSWYATPRMPFMSGHTYAIVWYGTLSSFASNQCLIGQWGGSGQASYMVYFEPGPQIKFYVSPDGTSNIITTFSLTDVVINKPFGIRVEGVDPNFARMYIDHGNGWGAANTKQFNGSYSGLRNPTADVLVGGRQALIDPPTGYCTLAQWYSTSYAPENLGAEFQPDQAGGFGTGQGWTSDEGEVYTGAGSAEIKAVNTLVYDSFTGVDGTLLENHTPDTDIIGDGWVLEPLSAYSEYIKGGELVHEGATSGVAALR